MRAWQWFMLIEGAISIAVAIAAAFVLPNWGESLPMHCGRSGTTKRGAESI